MFTYQAKIKSDINFYSLFISLDYEYISCIYSNIYENKGSWSHTNSPWLRHLKGILLLKDDYVSCSSLLKRPILYVH